MIDTARVVDVRATLNQRDDRAQVALTHGVVQRGQATNSTDCAQEALNATVDRIDFFLDWPLGRRGGQVHGPTGIDRRLDLRGRKWPTGRPGPGRSWRSRIRIRR